MKVSRIIVIVLLGGLAVFGLGHGERLAGDLELVLDGAQIELEQELSFLHLGVGRNGEMIDDAVERGTHDGRLERHHFGGRELTILASIWMVACVMLKRCESSSHTLLRRASSIPPGRTKCAVNAVSFVLMAQI